MRGWAEHMQDALQYIEEHLTDELEIEEISARVYVSPFHFQRIFSALCGITVGEYIRMRRLTLAGEELSRSDIRVIDAAVKYGYDSQDSFSRAFTRFHGISPKAAKEQGAELKSFAPLRIRVSLEGGMMMEYKIVEKAAFTIMGIARTFNADTSYQEIPKFWAEHYETGGGEKVMGMFGVCMDGDGKQFEYLIADSYCPCREIPEGCVTREIPAGTWAVFPCRGALPDSLQKVNTMIWTEWLPNCREYKLAGNYNIEAYLKAGDHPEDFYGEIWLPVKPV